MVCHVRHRAERATHVLDEHRRLREPARAVRLADHDSDRVRTDARERVLGARAVRRIALDAQPHMSMSSTYAESPTRDGARPSSRVAVLREPHARRRAPLEPRGRVERAPRATRTVEPRGTDYYCQKVYKVVVCVCLVVTQEPPRCYGVR